MKSGLIQLCAIAVVASFVSAAVAQDATPAAKPAKHEANAKRPEWHGVLAAPAAGAATNVVAVLTVKHPEAKSFQLTVADATLAGQVKELAAKGALVMIKGELNADGTTIAVTKAEAAKEKKAKPAAPAAN